MLLGKNRSSKAGKNIPQDWTEGLAVLLNDTYKSQCKTDSRYFDVYGQIFSEELLVVVSYLFETNEADTPVALFLSCQTGQMDTPQKVKETQFAYTDLAGLFFDEIFSQDDWSNFEPAWQEVDYKGQKYFYKITRENINLTIEADRLLGEEFLAEEAIDDDEEEDHKNYQ
jgi:hypothetical protein